MLIDWLRRHNLEHPPDQRVGFYGLDVYSLWDSLRVIIDYLQEHEPHAVEAPPRPPLHHEPPQPAADQEAYPSAADSGRVRGPGALPV